MISPRNKKERNMPKNPNYTCKNGRKNKAIIFVKLRLQYVHPASFFQATDNKPPQVEKGRTYKTEAPFPYGLKLQYVSKNTVQALQQRTNRGKFYF